MKNYESDCSHILLTDLQKDVSQDLHSVSFESSSSSLSLYIHRASPLLLSKDIFQLF